MLKLTSSESFVSIKVVYLHYLPTTERHASCTHEYTGGDWEHIGIKWKTRNNKDITFLNCVGDSSLRLWVNVRRWEVGPLPARARKDLQPKSVHMWADLPLGSSVK